MLTSHHNWNQRHEDGKHDSWKKTADHTHNPGWNMGQPVEPGVCLEVCDVGDQTDECNGDSPEDNHRSDEAIYGKFANHALEP